MNRVMFIFIAILLLTGCSQDDVFITEDLSKKETNYVNRYIKVYAGKEFHPKIIGENTTLKDTQEYYQVFSITEKIILSMEPEIKIIPDFDKDDWREEVRQRLSEDAMLNIEYEQENINVLVPLSGGEDVNSIIVKLENDYYIVGADKKYINKISAWYLEMK